MFPAFENPTFFAPGWHRKLYFFLFLSDFHLYANKELSKVCHLSSASVVLNYVLPVSYLNCCVFTVIYCAMFNDVDTKPVISNL